MSPPAPRLDHIGIAVPDLEAALRIWQGALGLAPAFRERVETEGVEVVGLDAHPARIELMQPTRADGPVAKFLERKGPGIHHLALRVDDIDAALAQARAAGLTPVGEAPRPGAHGTRVAFLHPAGTGGVLLELVQHGKAIT